MHEYTSHRPGHSGRIPGRMYDDRRAGPERGLGGAEVRERGAQDLHRVHRIESQERKPGLFLQLAAVTLVAATLAACTSAGSPTLEERNTELVCARHEAKICPAGVGTASRIRKDEGACYCAPREHVQR